MQKHLCFGQVAESNKETFLTSFFHYIYVFSCFLCFSHRQRFKIFSISELSCFRQISQCTKTFFSAFNVMLKPLKTAY